MKEYVRFMVQKISRRDSKEERIRKLTAIYDELTPRGYTDRQIAQMINDVIGDTLLCITNQCLRLMKEIDNGDKG